MSLCICAYDFTIVWDKNAHPLSLSDIRGESDFPFLFLFFLTFSVTIRWDWGLGTALIHNIIRKQRNKYTLAGPSVWNKEREKREILFEIMVELTCLVVSWPCDQPVREKVGLIWTTCCRIPTHLVRKTSVNKSVLGSTPSVVWCDSWKMKRIKWCWDVVLCYLSFVFYDFWGWFSLLVFLPDEKEKINHLNEENGRDEVADPREWQKKKGGKRGEWRDRRTKLTAFFSSSARSLLSPSDSRLRSTGRWVLLRHFSQYFTVCPFIPFSSTLISPLTTFIQPSPAWGITFTYTYLLVLYNGVWKAEFDWPLGGWIRCLFHPPHLLSSCSLSLHSVRRKGFTGGLRTN